MDLSLPTNGLERYKSASQRARVATEAWAEANLYCANCDSNSLGVTEANTPAIDYTCPKCNSPFQLKSQAKPIANRLMDAGYEAMRQAIQRGRTPNLLALHYRPEQWVVWDVIVVPHFAFSVSAVEKRKALGPRARRAGWVGCNIVLGNIPLDARISIVQAGKAAPPDSVRARFARVKPLAELSLEKRGWTLDVLNALRSIAREEFTLQDVYACEEGLAELHPANRHVRDKIRQQLQVLRDLGFVEFVGRGSYRLR